MMGPQAIKELCHPMRCFHDKSTSLIKAKGVTYMHGKNELKPKQITNQR